MISVMETIIKPVEPELVKAELTPERKLCDTNKGGNEIYVVDAFCAPNVMRELGRLREVSFRAAGGSSGLSADIDRFDTMEKPYQQIVVWDPDASRILGGYRFILGRDITIKEDGQPDLATSHMFRFSQTFISRYLPHVMELGRSFVVPEYQSSAAGAKAIFALDNLWDGISAIVMQNPQIMYFFGKMTIHPQYDRTARDLILHFLLKHFPDRDQLVLPIDPVMPETDRRILDMLLDEGDLKQDYRKLKQLVRRLGTSIPPLVNSYMNISPTMKMFGSAVNREFSNCVEAGILVCYDEMFPDSRDRHVENALKGKLLRVRQRFPKLTPQVVERLTERWDSRRHRLFEKFKHSIGKI